eukprot:gene26255-34879_t
MSHHQEIPIAVAEIVGTTTDRSQNSYDRELEQRVVSVQSELQKKSAHLEGLDTEIRTLKASLVPLLGAAFIRRIEEDPVWSDPSSEAFDNKFLCHEIPAVVNVATLVKRSHLLRDEHRELVGRLEQLRNDQRHNNYIPAELFRFIEDLRTEVASLRSMVFELMEEKRFRMEEEEKKAKMEEEKKAKMAVFQFDHFSAPNLVTVSKNMEESSCTMTYPGPATGFNYVSSSIPLPRDRSSQWVVDIVSHKSGWVMLGVIGNLQAVSDSRNDATCYAWACSNQVWIRGAHNPSHGSWVGWQTGDRGKFTYDPLASTLALSLVRGGTAQEFRIDNCTLTQAFIHVNFHANGTSLRFSNVNFA